MANPARSIRFPGVAISAGSKDSASVRAIQKRLNKIGCGPVAVDGVFGPETAEAVELFQARRADRRGRPLVVDGVVGVMTWTALFGGERTVDTPGTKLQAAVLKVADGEVGTMEQPAGSN